MRMKLKRPPLRTFLPFAIFGMGVGLVYFLLHDPLDDALPFDGALWRDAKSYQPRSGHLTDRQRMVRDVAEHVLAGRCEADMVRDLGPPEKTPYFSSTGRDMVYVLGPERGLFAIDSEWLLIWLDDKRCFKRHKVVTD
jgi:hypothetical protein